MSQPTDPAFPANATAPAEVTPAEQYAPQPGTQIQPQYAEPQYGQPQAQQIHPQPVQQMPHTGATMAAYPAYGQAVVKPKSPIVHLIASFIIPGLGQMLNGEVGKGIAFMVAYFISACLCIVGIGFFLLPVVNIWGLVDAYRGAQKWNAQHGIIS